MRTGGWLAFRAWLNDPVQVGDPSSLVALPERRLDDIAWAREGDDDLARLAILQRYRKRAAPFRVESRDSSFQTVAVFHGGECRGLWADWPG